MIGMQIESDVMPPPDRRREQRITAEIRAMGPGQSFVTGDKLLVLAFRMYGAYHGWETRQEKEDGGDVRVWRVS